MNNHGNPEVIFTAPEGLPGLEVPGKQVVVIDLPFALPVAPAGYPLSHPRTKAFYKKVIAETTLFFISKLGRRLVAWIDHHTHTAWKQFRQDPRFILVSNLQAPACALLIRPALFLDERFLRVDTLICHGDLDGLISAARFLRKGVLPYPKALEDAVTADTRQGKLSQKGLLIDRAIKAQPNENTRRNALQWLLYQDADSLQVLRSAEGLYPRNVLACADFQEIGGCRILDARKVDTPYDTTRTLCDLQEGGRVGIVIHQQGTQERIWVAGHQKGIDLPRLLDLPGGSPSRVCLNADHLQEAVTRINASVFKGYAPLAFPSSATIEITRRCNLHCALCPVGNQQARRMPDMEFEIYARIIDLFKSTLENLCLHNYGEPLLHPALAKFIRYAKGAGIRHVFLATNGNHLPMSLAKDIVTSGLDKIRFSVDTTNPGAYAQYRTGGELSQVLKNMRYLSQLRARLGASLPVIEAQALLMQQNEAFVNEFERIVRSYGADHVRYKTVNIFMSGEDRHNLGQKFLPDSPHYTRYSTKSPEFAALDSKMKTCSWPREQLVVLADGTIVPCCHDFNADHPLGKMTTGFEALSVWDTPERRSFMLRRILHPASIEMCRRCSLAVTGMDLHKLVSPEPIQESGG